MRGLIFLLVVVVAYTSAEYEQYCHLRSCKKDEKHTLCAYSSANKCARLISSGLSQNEKDRIVKLHNQLRQKVASGKEVRGAPGPQPPTATRKMANLVWDEEIAGVAQHWANQCNWGHDKCRNTNKEEYVGQNIAEKSTTGDVNSIPVEDMVQAWYDEVQYFDGRTLQGISGKAVGHYTQMVWSGTTKIGCGAVKYSEGGYNRFYLVCNYSPGGNIGGVKVYETKNNPTQNYHSRSESSYNKPQSPSHVKTSYSYSVNGKPVTKEEYENAQNQHQSSSYILNGKSVSKEEFEKKKQEYQAYLSKRQQ